jgi:hypothetical protein
VGAHRRRPDRRGDGRRGENGKPSGRGLKSLDFGFLFARLIKTFGFKHDEVLKMPIKRFWFYNKQVERMAAEEDLRMIELLAAVTSSEAYGKKLEDLRNIKGEIYVLMPETPTLVLDGNDEMDPEFDRAAFHALKAKIAAQVR